LLEDKQFEQLNVCLAFPGVSRDHPDRPAFLSPDHSSWRWREFQAIRAVSGNDAAWPTTRRSVWLLTSAIRVRDYLFRAPSRKVLKRWNAALPRSDAWNEKWKLIGSYKAKQFFSGRFWPALEDTNAVAGWLGPKKPSG